MAERSSSRIWVFGVAALVFAALGMGVAALVFHLQNLPPYFWRKRLGQRRQRAAHKGIGLIADLVQKAGSQIQGCSLLKRKVDGG